tara:strand:+ start:776 stop:1171 length:396 start_codon:yes stop_codon:yes gene_type:complete
MEFTGELPDNEMESVVEGWVDSNLDSHIQSFLDNNEIGTVDVEEQIRGLLEDFDPAQGGCRTARAFKEAVNGIMDERGEVVIKHNVDGLIGEVRDALAETVTAEVDRQVSVLIVNLQRGLRGLAIGETRAA